MMELEREAVIDECEAGRNVAVFRSFEKNAHSLNECGIAWSVIVRST
jgi:hypothetical protein